MNPVIFLYRLYVKFVVVWITIAAQAKGANKIRRFLYALLSMLSLGSFELHKIFAQFRSAGCSRLHAGTFLSCALFFALSCIARVIFYPFGRFLGVEFLNRTLNQIFVCSNLATFSFFSRSQQSIETVRIHVLILPANVVIVMSMCVCVCLATLVCEMKQQKTKNLCLFIGCKFPPIFFSRRTVLLL